jgi:hypothetical protein
VTLLRDERWPVARLIPITSSTGVEAKERNAASALLAVLAHVHEFGRTLLDHQATDVAVDTEKALERAAETKQTS